MSRLNVWQVPARLFAAVVAAAVLSTQCLPVAAASLNLNLSSNAKQVPVTTAILPTGHTASIMVGGQPMTVAAGASLTPAEYVALLQVVGSGVQQLKVNSQGVAYQGTFVVPHATAYSSLVVPAGVTALDPTSNVLKVVSGVSDLGRLIGIGAGGTTFNITAGSVNVGAGALLSTIVPSDVAAQTGRHVNLSIASLGDLINAGSITSSGVLKIDAQGLIQNTGSILGSLGATLTAASGQVTNTGGIISGGTGNLAFYTSNAADLVVEGGLLSGANVNFFGGNHNANIDVTSIDGIANIYGCNGHITVSSGTLNLGVERLTGDPIFANTGGDLVLNSAEATATNGATLTLLASGNISADSTVKQITLTGAGTGSVGNVFMVAGANITGGPAGTNPVSVTGASGTGGSINLLNVPIVAKSSSAGNGGNVMLAAFAGSNSSSGQISIGGVDTSSKSGMGGTVTMYAPGNIQNAGTIKTNGMAGGAVDIDNVAPTPNGTPTWSTSGTLTSASPAFTAGALGTGNLDIQKGITTNATMMGMNGGTVNLNGGNNVNVGFTLSSITPLSVKSYGGISTNSSGGTAGTVTINAGNDIKVAQGISATSASTTGAPTLVNVAATNLVEIDQFVNTSTTKTGAGGSISVVANGCAACPSTIARGPVGNDEFGLLVGPITTTGANGGGSVVLTSTQGNLIVAAGKGSGITTTSKDMNQPGSVVLTSQFNTEITGNISANGMAANSVTINAGTGNLGITEGRVILTGAISTNSTMAGTSGGAVTINAQTGANITGNITTTGTANGGNVNINPADGNLIVGSINTSGLASRSSTVPGGSAGSVTLGSAAGSGSFFIVNGSITADGGNNTNKTGGNAGAGGTVLIRSIQNTGRDGAGNLLAPVRIGGLIMKGSIDTRGGAASSSAGTGGAGGSVTVDTGMIQINSASAGGASVNASGGMNGTKNMVNGGTVELTTYGVQPVPLNFDLTSTAKTEVALPGAMFEVGTSTYNGSKGAIVSNTGMVVNQFKTPQRILATLNQQGTGAGSVSIQTGNPTVTINENGNTKTIDVINGTSPTSPRMMITPAEALAAMQNSEAKTGVAQTIGLLNDGSASDARTTGAAGNRIYINGWELGRQFTSFDLAANTQNHASITVFVNMTDANPTDYVQMPSKVTKGPTDEKVPSASSLFFGSWEWDDNGAGTQAKYGVFDFGSQNIFVGTTPATPFTPPLTEHRGSIVADAVGGPGGTMNIFFWGTGSPTYTNLGVIDVNTIDVRSAKTVNLVMGDALSTVTNNQIDPTDGSGLTQVVLGVGTQFAGTLNVHNTIANQSSAFSGNTVDLYGTTLTWGSNDGGLGVFGPVLNSGGNGQGLNNVEFLSSATVNSYGAINLARGGFMATGTGALTLDAETTIFAKGIEAFSPTTLNLTAWQKIAFNPGTLGGINSPNLFTATGDINMNALLSVGDNSSAIGSQFVSTTGNITTTGFYQGTSFTSLGNVWTAPKNIVFAGVGSNIQPPNPTGPGPTAAVLQIAGTATAGGTLTVGNAPTNLFGNVPYFGTISIAAGSNLTSAGNMTLTATDTPTAATNVITVNSTGALQTTLTSTNGNVAMTTLGNAFDNIQFGTTAGASNVLITAGSPSSSFAGGTSPIPASQIAGRGSVVVSSAGGITVLAASTPNAILNEFTTYGGDVSLTANGGSLALGNQVGYTANGGNLIFLASGNVTGGAGHTGPVTPGNSFTALAYVPTSGASTGGGVEINSGSVVSTIASVVANPPTPMTFTVPAGVSTTGVTSTAHGEVNIAGTGVPPGTITLTNSAGLTAAVNISGTNSVVLMNANSGSSITLNSVNITSAIPTADDLLADSSDVFVDTAEDDNSAGIADASSSGISPVSYRQ